ncbi:late embryogenesis abundant hydroxyproline-rich glycoprotein [Corchorus olitorius]|uniref:Late embryogenesis abundant hydroxyproline-rich glycoprotein n=1 Tax=Corchorus olitorius TaxID=93759 RepID=A0A1R3J664_9ROSI|nr:late embryogenesis abundant hydroxyproline-rich glycoprotein [Corchorus olitorius]
MEGRNGSCAIGIPSYANSSFNVEQRPFPSAPPLTQATTPTTRQRRPSATAIDAFRYFLAFAMLATAVVFLILLFGFTQCPKFGLTSLSVSKFNISGSEITAEWDVEFRVRNPNRVWTYWFDHPIVSVYYRDQLVSELELFPQIMLPKKTTKSYVGKTVAVGKRIEDREVAEAILRDWSEKGVVAFTTKLVKTDNNFTSLEVRCVDVAVGFSSSRQEGTMLLQIYNNNNSNNHSDYHLQQAFTRCSTYVKYDNTRTI